MDGRTDERLTVNHTDKQTDKHTYIQNPDVQSELGMSFPLLLTAGPRSANFEGRMRVDNVSSANNFQPNRRRH